MPTYTLIYEIVKRIPPGKVASYGQIAHMVQGGCTARMVGYAMAALKSGSHPDVPWQRVINAKGQISQTGMGHYHQRVLLIDEGVEFDDKDRIDWDKFGWLGE